MSDTSPLVSVGMPVYNGERYVEQAMRSILGQTYRNLELIVSDNASTDRTAEIVHGIAREDGRVRVSRNEVNQGSAANFNRVRELARGPYFRWACADDWSAPDLVARCVETLERRKDVVLCYAPATLVDEHGAVIRVNEEGLHLDDPDVHQRFLTARGHGGLLNVLQGVMRLDALRRIAPMGTYHTSDVVMAAELSLWGRFVELPQPMLFRRMHPSAFSASKTIGDRLKYLDPARRRQMSLLVWRRHWEFAKAVGRAPVPAGTRVKLFTDVARSVYWNRRQMAGELATAARDIIGRSSVEDASKRAAGG